MTRHGKPFGTLVSMEAAEIARKAMGRERPSLIAYLRTFPGGDFERNRKPARDVDHFLAFDITVQSPEEASLQRG
jgi:hypothetical protein